VKAAELLLCGFFWYLKTSSKKLEAKINIRKALRQSLER